MQRGVMKTIKDITMFLLEHEGKKLQVDVAQMSEIVKITSLMLYSMPESIATLITNGKEVYDDTLKEMDQEETKQ